MRKTTGISLILLIFLSLCLITFSLLSLSGATADERLSQKAADRTTEYYAAVSAANEVLAEIDTKLAKYLTMSYALYSSNEDVSENSIVSDDASDSVSTGTQSAELYWKELCTQLPDEIGCSVYPALLDTVCPERKDNENTVSFDIAVTENQQLHVVLELHYPEAASESMYDITEWKVINTQEWNADRSQNLFRIDTESAVQE